MQRRARSGSAATRVTRSAQLAEPHSPQFRPGRSSSVTVVLTYSSSQSVSTAVGSGKSSVAAIDRLRKDIEQTIDVGVGGEAPQRQAQGTAGADRVESHRNEYRRRLAGVAGAASAACGCRDARLVEREQEPNRLTFLTAEAEAEVAGQAPVAIADQVGAGTRASTPPEQALAERQSRAFSVASVVAANSAARPKPTDRRRSPSPSAAHSPGRRRGSAARA